MDNNADDDDDDNDSSSSDDLKDSDTSLQDVDITSFLCGLCRHNTNPFEFKTIQEIRKHHKEEHDLHFYTSISKTVQDFYDFALSSRVEIRKTNIKTNGKRKWLVIINDEGKGIFSIDCEISFCDGIALIQKLKSQMRGKNEKFLVLAGTHGNLSGQNYQFILENNKTIINAERLSSLKENKKYTKLDYSKKTKNILNGKRTTVLNGHEYKFNNLKEILISNKSHHVILLFCFSRNDVALRYLLDLEAVTSYQNYNSSDEEQNGNE